MQYEQLLSSRIQQTKPSGIRKFFDLANTMENVISLGVGEPDFQTPWSVRQVAIDSLERKRMIYSENPGLYQLRKEISNYLSRKYQLSYDPDHELIVTVGGSEAIDISLRTLVNPGDEILIPEPCFVCYSPLTYLAGGVPVPIQTTAEDQFKLKPEALKSKITSRTKALILPYPNNPTGAIMTREDLEAIAAVLKDTNIFVLSDEIYAELTYGTRHCSIASIEGMQERTVVISGFSKAFAMTGWRLGYMAAPEPITKEALKIHQYAIMCSPTVSQHAAIEALRNCDEEVAHMVSEYNTRRKFLVNSFNRMGLNCFEPEGAFYVFPSIQSTGMTSEEFCERLLKEEHVAVVPGTAFGDCGEGFIRVSYAYSVKHLLSAVQKIAHFIGYQETDFT